MWRRIWFLLNRRRLERELQAELEFHAEMTHGRMGDLTRWRERSRDVWSWTALDDFFRDMRITIRGMRRTPAFAAAAICLLALGIGAATAVHTVLRALLLAAVPVDEPSQLVQLVHYDPSRSKVEVGHSYPAWEMFAGPRTTVSSVFGFTDFLLQVAVIDRGAAELAGAQGVTANFFDALRLRPAAGRLLERVREPNIVLSHAYWQRRFGGDPSVIGRPLEIDGRTFGVAGIAPPEFRGLERGKYPDVFFPIEFTMEFRGGGKLEFAGSWWMSVMARLRPGATPQAAQSEFEVLSRKSRDMATGSLPAQFAGSIRKHFDQLQFRLIAASAGSYSTLQERSQRPMWVLSAAVALLLLIVCSNLAGLLASRGATREKELGIRVALGCGRGRLLRQMMTEAFVLSTFGGIVGLVLAWWAAPALLTLISGEDLLGAVPVTPDYSVLGLFVLTVGATALLIGCLPAWRAIASHSRYGASRPVKALLSLQVALSLVLLVCAALFARTLAEFRNVDPGFRRAALISARANPTSIIRDRTKLNNYRKAVLERLRSLPGIESATLSDSPLGSLSWTTMVDAGGRRATAGRNPAGPDFARTLGLRLLAGRDLSDSDYGRRTALVNRSFAQQFFDNSDAVGRTVRMLDGNKEFEIIGIVGDARDRGLKKGTEPVLYTWWEEDMIGWTTFTVRGHITGNHLRAALQKVNSSVPVTQVETADESLNRELARERMMASLGGAFGVVATLISAVGLYAALAFSLARRTREIGIRRALGATAVHVIATAARHEAVAVVIGIIAGVPAAMFAARALRSQFFGVGAFDPVAIVWPVGILALAAALASIAPVIRAASVAPADALRHEA